MAESDVYRNSKKLFDKLMSSMKKTIIGQEEVIEHMFISIITGNHALLEGYPGLGKTMMIRALAKTLDMKFSRIQCTPDLMPSDITGTYIIEEEPETGKKTFKFQEGPVFSNIVLADEINRTTPKTQAALLEAMQEKQVTLGNNTYPLELPFFVLATQNPLEMEGTYPLPEAQLDRFLLKLMVEYPPFEDEEKVVELYTQENIPEPAQVIDKKTVLDLGKVVRMMPISEDLREYVMRLVVTTRPGEKNDIANKYLDYGASSRAGIGIVLAAKARALINGKNFVSKEDVNTMALPVLRHRLILNFESEREGVSTDDVTKMILKQVK
jgi:MoxR-like ATPase